MARDFRLIIRQLSVIYHYDISRFFQMANGHFLKLGLSESYADNVSMPTLNAVFRSHSSLSKLHRPH